MPAWQSDHIYHIVNNDQQLFVREKSSYFSTQSRQFGVRAPLSGDSEFSHGCRESRH